MGRVLKQHSQASRLTDLLLGPKQVYDPLHESEPIVTVPLLQ